MLSQEADMKKTSNKPPYDQKTLEQIRAESAMLIARRLRDLSEVTMRADLGVSSSLIEVAALTVEMEGKSVD